MDAEVIKRTAYRAALHDEISVVSDIEDMNAEERLLYLQMLYIYRLYIIRRLALDEAKKIGLQITEDYNRMVDSPKPVKSKSAHSERFTPPDIEEIQAYCKERKNGVNPEEFKDFYESKGWMIGKNKMKDWKSAVRTWEKRKAPKVPERKTTYDIEEFERSGVFDDFEKRMGY